jgi:hypothetical protein
VETLAQRVPCDETLELGHQLGGLTDCEIGLDPFFECCHPKLLEAPDFLLRERVEGELRERRPAPKAECTAEGRGGVPCCACGERRASPVEQRREPPRVDLPLLEPQHVPRSSGEEDALAFVAKQLPELRDVSLEDLGRRRRWVLAPDLLDQTVGRDDPVRVQEQDGESGTPLPRSDLERATLPPDLERAQDTKLDQRLRTDCTRT